MAHNGQLIRPMHRYRVVSTPLRPIHFDCAPLPGVVAFAAWPQSCGQSGRLRHHIVEFILLRAWVGHDGGLAARGMLRGLSAISSRAFGH